MDSASLGKAKFLLGPWLIGCFLDILLQGILFCQFSHYYSWHREDKWRLRLAVVGLAILTTLKSIQSFTLIWIQLILNFQDLDIAIGLNYTTWWQSGNPLMVATIGLYVQVFFCYRLYVISKGNWWVVGPICAVLLFAYLSVIVATYYITVINSPAIATWFAAHLTSVFAGDLAMTTATTVYLLRSKRDVLPQTVGLISALVRLTFQTAAPAAVFAMFNLLFSQVYSGEEKLISTAFNQALPKLYAISMMWTLNARRAIRENGSRYPTSEETSGRGRRVVTGQRENVELASFGGVQVHQLTETTKTIDVRGMFHTTVPQEEDKLASPDQESMEKMTV